MLFHPSQSLRVPMDGLGLIGSILKFADGVSEGFTAERPGNCRQDQVLVLCSRSISYAIPIDQNVQISNTSKLLQNY